MPCYDPRDHGNYSEGESEGYRRGMADSLHNSPVAQLLCTLMKTLERNPGARVCDLPTPTELQKWWKDHKARDALKAKQEEQYKQEQKENARRKVERAERELRAAQEALKKIK